MKTHEIDKQWLIDNDLYHDGVDVPQFSDWVTRNMADLRISDQQAREYVAEQMGLK